MDVFIHSSILLYNPATQVSFTMNRGPVSVTAVCRRRCARLAGVPSSEFRDAQIKEVPSDSYVDGIGSRIEVSCYGE